MSDSIFPDVRAMDRAYGAVSLSRIVDPTLAEAVARALIARLTLGGNRNPGNGQ
ncbi:hypothetical protein [Polaromonas sp.]|uniref:hypothetical protein n=1 Tax=Polaromonas sp. TaxID=1869339 RepID=UPI00352B37DC